MLLHKLYYVSRTKPMFAQHFITADMQIGIGKYRCYFCNQFSQKVINGFIRWVQYGRMYSPVLFGLFWPGLTHQFRISNTESGRMARQINFGYDTNTSL